MKSNLLLDIAIVDDNPSKTLPVIVQGLVKVLGFPNITFYKKTDQIEMEGFFRRQVFLGGHFVPEQMDNNFLPKNYLDKFVAREEPLIYYKLMSGNFISYEPFTINIRKGDYLMYEVTRNSVVAIRPRLFQVSKEISSGGNLEL